MCAHPIFEATLHLIEHSAQRVEFAIVFGIRDGRAPTGQKRLLGLTPSRGPQGGRLDEFRQTLTLVQRVFYLLTHGWVDSDRREFSGFHAKKVAQMLCERNA